MMKLRSLLKNVVPGFVDPRRIAKKALTEVVQQACVQGISTRSIHDLVKVMDMSSISMS